MLTTWEALRGRRAILYMMDSDKPMTDEDLLPLYQCIRTQSSRKDLDLLLHTSGGRVNTARRCALLLRLYAEHLHIVIPLQARSAGTILSLAGDTLLLSPVAELSPIDPNIASAGSVPNGSPPMIASEDIRMFREMSAEWFGIQSDQQAVVLLQSMLQHIFPTTLSSFFRVSQQLRRHADKLLQYHLTDASQREYIIDNLLYGYGSHSESITYHDAQEIGLPVQLLSQEEESTVWRIWEECISCLQNPCTDPRDNLQTVKVSSIIASSDFVAYFLSPLLDAYTAPDPRLPNTTDVPPPRPQPFGKGAWIVSYSRKEETC